MFRPGMLSAVVSEIILALIIIDEIRRLCVDEQPWV